MLDQFHASCDERLLDLNCAVVGCANNLRLLYVTYIYDSLGNVVPPELRGPYLSPGYDYRLIINRAHPGLHQILIWRSQYRVKRYHLNFRLNDFADGRPDKPTFGFEPGQVFWICEGHMGRF